MDDRLQIQVLGELAVRQRGQLLPLPQSKKTRALLAYLAVVSRPQRREHLCSLLWDIPDDPRASLRWSLHKIRQIANATGQEVLAADRETVALRPDAIELDFARLPTRALKEIGTEALEGLAAVFRGSFLEGLSLPRCPKFESWRRHHADWALRKRIEILRELVVRHPNDPDHMLAYRSVLQRLEEAPREHGVELVTPETGEDRHNTAPSAGRGEPQEREGAAEAPSGGVVAHSQEIHFCRTADRVRVAYAVSGEGPPLVRAAHWMSHLQYDWESPVWRHWINALSEETRLIRYDERGNGLSDWDVGDISFAAMVADLESVIDAAGLERFTLLGVSQSCAVSIAYAVRHPERVSGLILYGGFVKGWRKRGDPHDFATHEAMTTLIREGWGKSNPVFRHLFTEMFIPDATQEQMGWFDELQRVTVSSQNAARLHEAFGEMDVSPLLAQVKAPTLVLHARHDAAVPFRSSREFAAGIPRARFVDLDSRNHILLSDEPAFKRFVEEVRRFVSETAGAATA